MNRPLNNIFSAFGVNEAVLAKLLQLGSFIRFGFLCKPTMILLNHESFINLESSSEITIAKKQGNSGFIGRKKFLLFIT